MGRPHQSEFLLPPPPTSNLHSLYLKKEKISSARFPGTITLLLPLERGVGGDLPQFLWCHHVPNPGIPGALSHIPLPSAFVQEGSTEASF